MSVKVLEMAQKYYPEYWSLERLNTLLEVNKLTQEEYDSLVSPQEEEEE